MKSIVARIAAVGAILFSLALVAPPAAYADGHGTAPSSQRERQIMKAFKASEVVINRHFRVSIVAAKTTLRTRLASAKTPGARTTLRIKFTLAVIAASTERDAELVQLGPDPNAGVDSSDRSSPTNSELLSSASS